MIHLISPIFLNVKIYKILKLLNISMIIKKISSHHASNILRNYHKKEKNKETFSTIE
jgi:hypothetical protein